MLEISNISSFHGDIQALWDVSVTVEDGRIVTLVGSNGAGKSTLMQSITGLVKPKTGSISFGGIRIDKLPAHRIVDAGICLVPEGRRLFPRMTVLENLEVGASVKAARKARQQTIEWVYEIFPILKMRSKQKAGALSGGEQQMLAIGRALMSKPKLLLIDEMSLGLSPLAAQTISQVIKRLNESARVAILLVEQDVQLALTMADWGYVMENGRIIGQGEAKKLLCSREITEAYLGMAE
ncbi:MAG: ABC transporter ATP-binding protein [Syntrophorhabdales bacterium]